MCCFSSTPQPASPIAIPRWGVAMLPGSAEQYSDVTGMGVHMVRRGLRWTAAEPNAPVAGVRTYTWVAHDAAVARANAAGVKLLGVLANGPQWACPGPANSGPTNVQDYLDYVNAISARYTGRVDGYEIWNESQGNGLSTLLYKTMLIGAYLIIKANDPAAMVVGIVANGTFVDANSATRNAWYNTVLSDAQVRASMDAASVHTYTRPYPPEIGAATGPLDVRLANSNALLASKGFSNPVFVTEGNWPSAGTTPGVVSEADQARFIVRMAIINGLFCARFYPFHMYGYVSANEAGGMGFIRPDGTHKPSYTAWRTMAGVLDDSVTNISAVSTGNTRCYRFDRSNGTYGFAAWCVTGTADLQLTGLPLSIRQTTLLGVESILATTDGALTVALTGDPVYIDTQ